MKKILYFAVAFAVALTYGCNHNSTAQHDHEHEHAEGEAAHEHAEGEANEIVFTPEQAALTDFAVEAVEPTRFSQVIKVAGEVTVAQSAVNVVTAPVGGVVTLSRGIMRGADVVRGVTLMTISSRNMASGDATALAEAAYKNAEADYQRSQRLYDDKIISQREFLDVQTAYLEAKARWEPLKENSAAGSTAVKSSVAGNIATLNVTSGDYVVEGGVVATVNSSNRMQLEAFVPQRYFSQLSDINDARFTIDGVTRTVSDMGGRVAATGRSVLSGSNMVSLLFEFDGRGELASGVAADVALLGKSVGDVLTLPLTAITEQQGLYYVYVQLDEECYMRRQVVLGADDGIRVEIASGIEAGERVVTRGAVNVKMASFSGAIPEGHNHSH